MKDYPSHLHMNGKRVIRRYGNPAFCDICAESGEERARAEAYVAKPTCQLRGSSVLADQFLPAAPGR